MPPPTTSSSPRNLQERITVNGKEFIKLKQIGKGGSCVVYRVLNEDNEILALKCVSLDGIRDYQYNDYVNEVKLLESLRGSPGIIHLVDYELVASEKMLYIVLVLHIPFIVVNGMRRIRPENVPERDSASERVSRFQLHSPHLAADADGRERDSQTQHHPQRSQASELPLREGRVETD